LIAGEAEYLKQIVISGQVPPPAPEALGYMNDLIIETRANHEFFTRELLT
jgi:hypothetical protein